MAAEAAVAEHVPVEVYLRSDYEPDADYVDGVIEERSMGVYDHASWQRAIQKWFMLYEEEWNVRIFAELRIKVAEMRYRIPDIVLVDHSRPVEQVLTHPPLAVFEVLSPDDSIMRMLTKLEDYERMSIRSIFVIQPKSGAVYRFRQGGLEQLAADVSSIAPGPYFIDWRTVAGYLG